MKLETIINFRRELDRIEGQVRETNEELAKLREIERRARDLVTAEHMPILDVDQCRRSLVEALDQYRPL